MNTTAEVKKYLDIYESLKKREPKEPPWLLKSREEAIQSFSQNGFPTPKHTSWRHTDITAIRETSFVLESTMASAPASLFDGFKQTHKNHSLFFVNGNYERSLSTVPEGIRVLGIGEALEREPELLKAHWGQGAKIEGHALIALNTAFSHQGVLLVVEKDTKIEEPIYLVFSSMPGQEHVMFHPRILILAKEQSQATLVETYVSEGEKPYWLNMVMEIFLSEGAALQIFKNQSENLNAFHFSTKFITQKSKSSFSLLTLACGAKWMRDECRVNFEGEEAEAFLRGLDLAEAGQILDYQVLVDHQKPSCRSHQLFKGVLAGRSRGIFHGKVFVHKNAQHTDAHQTSKNLLLSNEAEADAQPQLEILADDVQCSHGAAIGPLEEDPLFYLRSRGIGEKEATRILAEGFARELLEAAANGVLKEELMQGISQKLAKQLSCVEENS